MTSLPFLLLLGCASVVCVVQLSHETIDLCRKATGVVEHSGVSYKAWLFSCGSCCDDGTLVFNLIDISRTMWSRVRYGDDYFSYCTSRYTYDNKECYTSNKIQITGIRAPLWNWDKRQENRTLNASYLPAVMIYNNRFRSSSIKIQYEFRKADRPFETTAPSPTDGALTTALHRDNDASISFASHTTYQALTITFAAAFIITLAILVIALLRIRQLKQSGSNASANGDTYATIQKRNTENNVQEARINELYHL